jgi:oligoendopeptidase F
MVHYPMVGAASSFDFLDVRASTLLDQLQGLEQATVTLGKLDDWLNQLSHLEREVQTLWITHILAVKRNANDEDAKALYKHLVKHWIPKIETQIDVLHNAACALDLAKSHPNLASHFESDRVQGQSQQQLSLQAQERVLITEYDTIVSNKSVAFEGRNLKSREVESIIKSTVNREKREELWHLIKDSELKVTKKLDVLFTALLDLRQNLAAASGYNNYVEYVWQ